VEREQLHAVADSEHRDAALESSRQHASVEVELVARGGVELHSGWIAPIRQEVAATGNEEAIEAVDQRGGVLLERQAHRRSSRRFDGARIAEIEGQGRASRGELPAVIMDRRNADERAHGWEYTLRGEGTMARVLIAGCGYLGAALGAMLDRDSHAVFGLRRRSGTLPWGVRPIEADLVIPGTLRELPPQLDFVFFMAAPAGRDDGLYRTLYVEGLRNLLDALAEQGQQPKRIYFTSSTSVYGQKDGEWVDESSPTEPASFAGRRILEAEALLAAGPFPASVVRFGGIYGPRRTSLVERVRTGRLVYQEEPPRYTNRIHRDDCAGALRHLMQLPEPEALYLGVDCEPASEATVTQWLAGVLGAPPPRPGTPDATADPGRAGSKRCRNDRLLASGYEFQYPTFREGYTAVLAELP